MLYKNQTLCLLVTQLLMLEVVYMLETDDLLLFNSTNIFIPAFLLLSCPVFVSSFSLPAHSSCPGHGQRQRQRGCRSPGGGNRKGGGACGCTWWQATQVPRWVTAFVPPTMKLPMKSKSGYLEAGLVLPVLSV